MAPTASLARTPGYFTRDALLPKIRGEGNFSGLFPINCIRWSAGPNVTRTEIIRIPEVKEPFGMA
jgi:hypothetical protein